MSSYPPPPPPPGQPDPYQEYPQPYQPEPTQRAPTGPGPYGYPPQQPGYPPQQSGYPPQQPGYPPQQPGYPPSQPYPQPGYPPSGYPASQPYPQPSYPPSQGGYPPQGTPPANRNNGLIIGLSILGTVVVIVVLLGVIGALQGGKSTTSLSPTATTAPTNTPKPALANTYNSVDGGYKVGYPSGWSVQTVGASGTQGAIGITSSDTNSLFGVFPLTFSGSFDAFYTGFLQGDGTAANSGFGATNVQIDSAPTTVTIGANQWQVLHSTFSKDGVDYQGAQYGMTRNGNAFIVTVLAPASSYAATDAQNFQPMLLSLTFTG